MANLEVLSAIAEQEFSDMVDSTEIIRDKLRVVLIDESYIDFWWSTEIEGRFACHWERTHVDGKIFRHNNMPHARWKSVKTFPQHFHDGDSGEVIESFLVDDPEGAVREFLSYARMKLRAVRSWSQVIAARTCLKTCNAYETLQVFCPFVLVPPPIFML